MKARFFVTGALVFLAAVGATVVIALGTMLAPALAQQTPKIARGWVSRTPRSFLTPLRSIPTRSFRPRLCRGPSSSSHDSRKGL